MLGHHTLVMAYMQRPEDNLWDSVLFLHRVGRRGPLSTELPGQPRIFDFKIKTLDEGGRQES